MKEPIAILEIDLTPSLEAPMKDWVSRFMQNEQCWSEYPTLEGNKLRISAISLPFFLAYVDPRESNELDIRRLRTQGKKKIQSLCLLSETIELQKCYSRVLDNLESIQVGEFHQQSASAI